MKIISWNVNGIRAITKKDFFNQIKEIDSEIICIQETKAQDEQVSKALESIEGYSIYSYSAERKGYSGTAILSKIEPLSISKGMGIEDHDNEGRILCLEYENFFLINVYVPNSGSELARLDYRKQWDIDFFNFLKSKEKTKPIIVCGDMNVAHKDIDIARPKANYNKSAGFTQTEIDGMDRLTNNGLLDTFRYFYPNEKEKYSWWSYRGGARQRNIGWRIDYFLCSESLIDNISDSFILNDMMGSDHCPVGIILK